MRSKSLVEDALIGYLDRWHDPPGLPLKRNRGTTMAHAYKRHGTTTLFAAMNAPDGQVISLCQQRHRHQEWLRFLKLIDDATPRDHKVHLIVDAHATHKHPNVQRWLRHPRFHVHFTPTSSSRLNMVERLFRDLTQNRIRPGVFRGLLDLITAIDEYVHRHNDNPQAYISTDSASDILEKFKRALTALNGHSV